MKERPQTAIRERLNGIIKKRERLAKMYDRLAAMELRLSTPSSPNWDKIGNSGTPNHDALTDKIAAKIDFEAKIRNVEAEIRAESRELSELFEQLDAKQELVCCLRYVDGLSWHDTIAAMYDSADDFDLNEDIYANKAFKIHGLALKKLDEITAEEE